MDYTHIHRDPGLRTGVTHKEGAGFELWTMAASSVCLPPFCKSVQIHRSVTETINNWGCTERKRLYLMLVVALLAICPSCRQRRTLNWTEDGTRTEHLVVTPSLLQSHCTKLFMLLHVSQEEQSTLSDTKPRIMSPLFLAHSRRSVNWDWVKPGLTCALVKTPRRH